MSTDATNSLKTSVSNGKSAVASAITDKGVSTAATATFDTMATNIRSIPTGPKDVFDSFTFVRESSMINYYAKLSEPPEDGYAYIVIANIKIRANTMTYGSNITGIGCFHADKTSTGTAYLLNNSTYMTGGQSFSIGAYDLYIPGGSSYLAQRTETLKNITAYNYNIIRNNNSYTTNTSWSPAMDYELCSPGVFLNRVKISVGVNTNYTLEPDFHIWKVPSRPWAPF